MISISTLISLIFKYFVVFSFLHTEVQYSPQFLSCVTVSCCSRLGMVLSPQSGPCQPPHCLLAATNHQPPGSSGCPWSPVPSEAGLSCRHNYLVFNSDFSFLIYAWSPPGCVFWISGTLTVLTPSSVTCWRSITVQVLHNVGFPQALAEHCSCYMHSVKLMLSWACCLMCTDTTCNVLLTQMVDAIVRCLFVCTCDGKLILPPSFSVFTVTRECYAGGVWKRVSSLAALQICSLCVS